METYGYRPLYFVSRKRGGLETVVPVMEVDSLWTGRRGVSLPFTDYCDPILADEGGFSDVLPRIQRFGEQRGWDYLEMRGTDGALGVGPCSAEYYGHRLSLARDEEAFKKKIRNSTLRNIKKAVAAGVEVEVLDSVEGMREFYRLNSLTRRDHGLPPQPWKFFERLHGLVLSTGKGFLALGRFQGQTIAGVFFFAFGQEAIFKYGASEKRFQHLRANNLIMWEAIRRCREMGMETLCLGRTDLDHQGLKQFKDGWGARETRIAYVRYDFRRETFRGPFPVRSGLPEKVFRKLPLPLLEALGRVLYKHMG